MTPAADAPVDATRFRRLMGRWATGVSVVTAHHSGADAGLTVNALVSVSLRPPSVLVSLSDDTDTLPVVERTGHFGVSFLSASQRATSDRFARTLSSVEKFRDVPVHRAPHGSPLLDGALGGLECRLASRTPAYDHVLLVGEVVYEEVGAEGLPLVFFRSDYSTPDDGDRLRFPPRHP